MAGRFIYPFLLHKNINLKILRDVLTTLPVAATYNREFCFTPCWAPGTVIGFNVSYSICRFDSSGLPLQSHRISCAILRAPGTPLYFSIQLKPK